MDGTVISDTVNAASIIEALNKIYGTHILISDQALSLVENKQNYYLRFIDHVALRGKSQAIKLYEVFNLDPQELIEKKLAVDPDYQKAMNAYRTGDFENALNYFEEIKKILPEDKVISIYINRCTELKQRRIANWKSIVKLSQHTETSYV